MKMAPLQIIGHAGCGKTTLIVDLTGQLILKGLRVGTIKHSAHTHELDKPGKDSFLHRKAGAVPCAMMTADMTAIYLPRNENQSPLDIIEQYYSHTDIVLIEGWISGPCNKIEVWRHACNRKPLFHDVDHVKAIVADQKLAPDDIIVAEKKGIKIFPRSDLTGIVNYMGSIN